MYTFDSRIRYSEVDAHKKLTLTGIANYFQDCSTFQSEDLNVGIETLSKQHRAWLLNSWQIVVKRAPLLCEKVTLGTWPYDFKGIYGLRNFIMKDEAGEICAYANSVWICVDTVSGHPTRITPEMIAAYSEESPFEMEYAARKIPVPKVLEERPAFDVTASNIDTNQHVNNAQYILMAQEYLPENFEVGEFRVEYRKAAVLGDRIFPKVAYDETHCTVVLTDEAQHIFAVLAFFKKGI